MIPLPLAGTIDDLMRSDLQYWRDQWFLALLVSTAVVGIGILMEGPEVWHQMSGMVRSIFCADKAEHAIPAWITLLASIGWLLIALGVIGEGITEAVVSSADGNLQTFNDILLTEARKEAGNAKQSALDAARAAARANALAATASIAAGEAMQKARAAEEYSTPRTISDKQIALIRKLVAPLEGHTLEVFTNSQDAEIAGFTNRLFLALGHGIMKFDAGFWIPEVSARPGFRFRYGKDRKKDFELIVNALDAAGVEKAQVLRSRSVEEKPPADPMRMDLDVGAKH